MPHHRGIRWSQARIGAYCIKQSRKYWHLATAGSTFACSAI